MQEGEPLASGREALPLRRRLMAALEDLPHTATFDGVVERLDFVYSVQAGLAQADQGTLTPHEQVKRSARAWLP